MLFEVQFVFSFSVVVNGVLTPEYEKIQDRKKSYILYDNWSRSQVFIFYQWNTILKGTAPECHGTLLTDEYVLAKGSCIISGLRSTKSLLVMMVRGHSTTTWTEFCHFLTPPPLRGHFLYPERGQK